MSAPAGTTFYTCIHCRDQVYVRGDLLVVEQRREGMILDSDCPGQAVPGHASPRWGTHEVSAADLLTIKLAAEHRWHLQVGP